MVVGGYNGVTDVEIVNIGKSNNEECPKPANMNLFDADFGTGIFFKGKPMVCEENNCATYSFKDEEWTLGPNPIWERDGARAAIVGDDDMLWLTGGRGQPTSELLVGGLFRPGPELPMDNFLHCLVRVNETHYLMIGGRTNGRTTDKVFFYDWPNQQWTEAQSMAVPRDLHSCALLTDTNSVIAMGGHINKDLSSSEIFDLGTETWSTGPELPGGSIFAGSQAVPYMGSVLLFGGARKNDIRDQEFHQLDLMSMEWVKRPELMQKGRLDFIGFEIPQGTCNPN